MLLLCIGLMIVVAAAGCQTSKKPMAPAKKPAQVQKKPAVDMSASERRVMANRLSRIAEGVPGVKKATVVVMDMNMTSNTTGTTTTPKTITGTGKTTTGTGTTGGTGTIGGTSTTGRTGTTTGTSTANKSTMSNKSGTMVMVGLTLNSTTGNSAAKTASTKSMVAKRIKASDKRISQVLVTTDPNLIKRLNDIAAGILEGKPVQSFSKDVRDLNTKLKQQKSIY